MRDFRKYDVWKNAIEITTIVYQLTKSFPSEEKYGLANQIQRASVSIASNIAEGSSRSSEADFSRFLEISLGSAFEVETQVLIAMNLKYITKENHDVLHNKLNIVQKQLNQLISMVRGK
ncbi:MAG: four helix bundle protein [Bacteroidales bacterium]|jgi:four helix bundle protein|nr:four helix bundle protein [Bacteroidales bacterium]MEA5099171.1 four helix bundle protein [Bacteroidales bacterium]